MSAAISTSALVIAPMTEADVQEVAALEAESFPAPASMEQDRVSRLREELARPWSRAWVARVGGRLVAFVLLWNVVDEIHVLNLATRPGERRRGHARALLQHVLLIARATGMRHLLLEVRRSNVAALALYRQHGFGAVRLRRKYYDDDEDAVEMALSLDPATGENLPRMDEVVLD
jgi:ribosomal-protein-alanine N-acetyltransferase